MMCSYQSKKREDFNIYYNISICISTWLCVLMRLLICDSELLWLTHQISV